jgi:hypothetical protein
VAKYREGSLQNSQYGTSPSAVQSTATPASTATRIIDVLCVSFVYIIVFLKMISFKPALWFVFVHFIIAAKNEAS